ncbi:unnamed protein product [Cyprideis torosa]|uniref:Uncharacterized protein n=1 Tax=Cyprideis torosa TaxID=163714 RepID=A0A7R8WI53_9CRUS|nr:unnamed protein product [Cyprideis torosa]CAG0894090.1 unnamed protein product [Cyprideis torosa]
MHVALRVIGVSVAEEEAEDDDEAEAVPKSKYRRLGEAQLKRILERIEDSSCMTFAEAWPEIRDVWELKKVRPTPWNSVLKITPSLSISVSFYITLRESRRGGSWKQGYCRDPGAIVSRDRSYQIFREVKDAPGEDQADGDEEEDVEDGEYVSNEDLVPVYWYGSTKVPMTRELADAVKYNSGPKGVFVLGWFYRNQFPIHYRLGDGTLTVTAKQGDEISAKVLSCLASVMRRKDCLCLASRIKRDNGPVGLGVIVWDEHEQELVWIDAPFAEDERPLRFPSLTPDPDKEALVDELIDRMDLMAAAEDDQGQETEAYDPQTTSNPYYSRLYQCLTYRALNPGTEGELPPFERDLEICLRPAIPPSNLKGLLQRIQKTFDLKEVVEKKKRGASVEEELSDAKKAKVDDNSVEGDVDLVQKFRTAVRKTESKAIQDLQSDIVILVLGSFGSSALAKARTCLEALKDYHVQVDRKADFDKWWEDTKELFVAKGHSRFVKEAPPLLFYAPPTMSQSPPTAVTVEPDVILLTDEDEEKDPLSVSPDPLKISPKPPPLVRMTPTPVAAPPTKKGSNAPPQRAIFTTPIRPKPPPPTPVTTNSDLRIPIFARLPNGIIPLVPTTSVNRFPIGVSQQTIFRAIAPKGVVTAASVSSPSLRATPLGGSVVSHFAFSPASKLMTIPAPQVTPTPAKVIAQKKQEPLYVRIERECELQRERREAKRKKEEERQRREREEREKERQRKEKDKENGRRRGVVVIEVGEKRDRGLRVEGETFGGGKWSIIAPPRGEGGSEESALPREGASTEEEDEDEPSMMMPLLEVQLSESDAELQFDEDPLSVTSYPPASSPPHQPPKGFVPRLDKPYVCRLCDKGFATSGQLLHHSHIHNASSRRRKPMLSPTASKPRRRPRLRKPAPAANGAGTATKRLSPMHECENCGKKFVRLLSLQSHRKNGCPNMAANAERKSLTCSFCSRTFTQLPHLNDHLRTHTGEKPFNCALCSRSFVSLSALRYHSRVNHNRSGQQKPFSCTTCSKSFSHVSHLKDHMRIHTGDRPFKCGQCDKSFVQQPHLRQHERTHTGEKPFACHVEDCDRKFSDRSSLRRHLAKVHGEVVGPQISTPVEEEEEEEESPEGMLDPSANLEVTLQEDDDEEGEDALRIDEGDSSPQPRHSFGEILISSVVK